MKIIKIILTAFLMSGYTYSQFENDSLIDEESSNLSYLREWEENREKIRNEFKQDILNRIGIEQPSESLEKIICDLIGFEGDKTITLHRLAALSRDSVVPQVREAYNIFYDERNLPRIVDFNTEPYNDIKIPSCIANWEFTRLRSVYILLLFDYTKKPQMESMVRQALKYIAAGCSCYSLTKQFETLATAIFLGINNIDKNCIDPIIFEWPDFTQSYNDVSVSEQKRNIQHAIITRMAEIVGFLYFYEDCKFDEEYKAINICSERLCQAWELTLEDRCDEANELMEIAILALKNVDDVNKSLPRPFSAVEELPHENVVPTELKNKEDELILAISTLNKDFTQFKEIEDYINSHAGRLEKRKAIRLAIKNQRTQSCSKLKEHYVPFAIGSLSMLISPFASILCSTPEQMLAVYGAAFGLFCVGGLHYLIANEKVLTRERNLKRLYKEC